LQDLAKYLARIGSWGKSKQFSIRFAIYFGYKIFRRNIINIFSKDMKLILIAYLPKNENSRRSLVKIFMRLIFFERSQEDFLKKKINEENERSFFFKSFGLKIFQRKRF